MMVAAAFAMAGAAFADEPAWQTNYEAALAKAKASAKPVFVEFTGSDWCPPCQMLSREILEQKAFKEYAAKNLVLLELDYPMNKEQSEDLKKQNQELSEKYAIQGFPTVIFLDAEGKELGRHVGYLPGGPDAMISWIEQVSKG